MTEIITIALSVGIPVVGGTAAIYYKLGRLEQKVTGNYGHITELKEEVKKIKDKIFNGFDKKNV